MTTRPLQPRGHTQAGGRARGQSIVAPSHSGAHIVSARALIAAWAALMALTGITVAATWIDLGSPGNVVVAMGIATLKGLIVALVFMHLWYDQKFNLIVFVVCVLTVVLFVAITFMDVGAYQPSIEAFESLKPQEPFLKPAP